jgi:hypothetical protein
MNENTKPPRGLDKVYHFFLTDETPANQDPVTPVGNCITNEITHIPDNTIHQGGVEYDRLKNTVAKLFVLRESCKGNYFTQNPDNDLIWLAGAEDILQDAIANLIKTLRFMDIITK